MIRFVVLGVPVSHKNGYRIVTIKGRPAIIKSKEALTFERDTLRQIPPTARQRLEGPVRIKLRMFYTSERPDLDESLLLDCLQDRFARRDVGSGVEDHRVLVQAGVYRNDKQVRSKTVEFFVDATNPRIEVEVEPMLPQQAGLDLAAPKSVARAVPASLLFPDEVL